MKIKRHLPLGGQALPNGVMMRSPYKTSIALRHHTDKILITSWPNKRSRIVKKAIFRGIYQLFVSMTASIRTFYQAVKLSRSAGKLRISPLSLLSLVAALMLFGLYVFSSVWLYNQLDRILPDDWQHYLLTLLYGIMDLIIFSLVLFVMTRLPVLKKLLRYHGAEHKAINCYEKGLEMTVENVREQTRFHRRCGTTMVVTVALAGILLPVLIPPNLGEVWQDMILAACLLIAVGMAYEAMRSNKTTFVARLGMAAQRMTTQEPDDTMIECAIAAVNEAANIASD